MAILESVYACRIARFVDISALSGQHEKTYVPVCLKLIAHSYLSRPIRRSPRASYEPL